MFPYTIVSKVVSKELLNKQDREFVPHLCIGEFQNVKYKALHPKLYWLSLPDSQKFLVTSQK